MLHKEITLLQYQYPIELKHKNEFMGARDNQNIEGWKSILSTEHLLLVFFDTGNVLHINIWSEYTSIKHLILQTRTDPKPFQHLSIHLFSKSLLHFNSSFLLAAECLQLLIIKVTAGLQWSSLCKKKIYLSLLLFQEILANAGDGEDS